MHDFDIIINGAGMVGATLALALGQSGRRVGLLEKQVPELNFDVQRPFDLRVSAINLASQRVFENLHAWPAMCEKRVSPFDAMAVNDSTGDGTIRFAASELAEPLLGHIIENSVIQTSLLETLANHPRVDFLSGRMLNAVQFDTDRVVLGFDQGDSLSAKLLVAADGAGSVTRRLAGIATTAEDYQQRAIVCTVRPEHSHQWTAWQRFLPTGPIALLPLLDGSCSVVWSVDEGLAAQLEAQSDTEFTASINHAFTNQLGHLELKSQRLSFPLASQHAQQYVLPRLALVGDAAHRIHPLAGQGVNIGILDVAVLAQVLAENQHRDPGSIKVLRAYQAWRKAENQLMLSSMAGFHHLFGSSDTRLAWLRNLGMTLTGSCAPLKHLLASHAMGRAGRLPRLAQLV